MTATLKWFLRDDSDFAANLRWFDGHGFFAVGGTAGDYQFSTNGVTWATRSIGTFFFPQDIAYSPSLGLFVAVGEDQNSFTTPCVMSSPDGVAWTGHSSPFDTDGVMAAVCWSESQGIFLATGYSNDFVVADRYMTSANGTAWTGHAAPWGRFDADIQGVTWVEAWGLWVVGAGGDLWTSPDASAWTQHSQSLNGTSGFAWDDQNGILAASCTRFAPNRQVVWSGDGSTWTQADVGLTQGYGVAALDGRVYVCGYKPNSGNKATMYSSSGSDMVSWELEWQATANGAAYSAAASTVTAASVLTVGAANKVYLGYGAADTPHAVAPLWRFFVADLDGFGITDYSKLASDRVVEVTLNAPLSVQGTVPSDNPQVWIPYDGDGYNDPYLSEGTRLLWGFRRESNTPPYYTVRAATLVQLVQDEAEQDDARTRFQAWDPWYYMLSRPVMNADGVVPGKQGLSYTNTQASVIIAQLLRNTIDWSGFAYIDAGVTYSGTADYDGTLETGAGMEIDINFQQGTSVGQAWQQITDLDVCDIVLEPIYDPANRPRYLCQLNVYAKAGVTRDEQTFAWNLPGRSLVAIDRREDGTQRANTVFFRAGQGGSWGDGTILTDGASSTKYGEYWAQQFFPGVTGDNAVDVVNFLAQQQLELRADGRETVTFKPAPERSPRPWQDYQLGDRVPVWASATKFRRLLGAEDNGTMTVAQYQRIYGWRANISDDALETIDPVLTSPQGFTA